MKTPEADDLRFAAEWLRVYDDTHDGGEQSEIAEHVAAWLDEQADAKEMRSAAREHGVPVRAVRERIKANISKTLTELLRVRGDVEIPGVGDEQAA